MAKIDPLIGRMKRSEFADLLVSVLQNSEGVRPPTEEEFEAEVQAKCIELWKEDQRAQIAKVPSLKSIPRLFTKRDFAPNSIAEHTRREARIRMLKKQESLLLEQEHLELAQQVCLFVVWCVCIYIFPLLFLYSLSLSLTCASFPPPSLRPPRVCSAAAATCAANRSIARQLTKNSGGWKRRGTQLGGRCSHQL